MTKESDLNELLAMAAAFIEQAGKVMKSHNVSILELPSADNHKAIFITDQPDLTTAIHKALHAVKNINRSEVTVQ